MTSISIQVPKAPLGPYSLQVTDLQQKSFLSWSLKDHKKSFSLLHKVVQAWKERNIGDNYLVYGKCFSDKNSFSWEAVPCPFSSSTAFFGQFLILWRLTWGGASQLSQEEISWKEAQQKLLQSTGQDKTLLPAKRHFGLDPFCNKKILDKQTVFEGKLVRVLYDHAPLALGEERLHFLVIPKEHAIFFHDLQEKEYVEMMEVAQKIIRYFFKNSSAKEAYLFHKNGKMAGQSVPHFHMHLVFTSGAVEEFLGKVSVLRKMLMGSSPMSLEELKKKVESFRLALR